MTECQDTEASAQQQQAGRVLDRAGILSAPWGKLQRQCLEPTQALGRPGTPKAVSPISANGGLLVASQ